MLLVGIIVKKLIVGIAELLCLEHLLKMRESVVEEVHLLCEQ